MAKETVEKEREVVETVTERETLWRCDDCQREFNEEELVEVAVAPDVQEIGKDALSYRVRKEMHEVAVWKREFEKSQGKFGGFSTRDPVEMQQELDWVCEDVAKELLKEMDDGRKYTAASVLDVCPECLKDDFGVEVEEHDDRLFEERNYEETVEKRGLGKRTRVFFSVVSVAFMGMYYNLGLSGASWTVTVPLLFITGALLYGALRKP